MKDKYLSKLEKTKENLNAFKKGYKNTFSYREGTPKSNPLRQGLDYKNFKFFFWKSS